MQTHKQPWELPVIVCRVIQLLSYTSALRLLFLEQKYHPWGKKKLEICTRSELVQGQKFGMTLKSGCLIHMLSISDEHK